MKVLLNRRWKKSEYTIGEWIVDGVKICNVLENPDRGLRQDMSLTEIKKRKVPKNTAIPTGHYIIKMTYSPRFKCMMPQILDVIGFSGIRVHSGNWVYQTDGCPLLGDNTKKGFVGNSKKRCEEFTKALIAAGGTCELDVR